MSSGKARVVNVIVYEENNNKTYFTLEGVEIGSFVEGKVHKPKQEVKEDKPKSGVTRSMTPEQIKREQEKRNEKTIVQSLLRADE